MVSADDHALSLSAKTTRRSRRWLIAGIVAVLIVGAWFGRGAAAWRARRAAEQEIRAGAVGQAERWLAWAARIGGEDYRNDLLLAAGFRALGDRDHWEQSMTAAEKHDANIDALRLEKKLGRLQWGEIEQVAPDDFAKLVKSGAAPRDAAAAVVHGLSARRDVDAARRVLAAWQPQDADEAQAALLRGLCFWSEKDFAKAQQEFELALQHDPRCEPARANLGRIFEQQEQLEQALPHYIELLKSAPQRESAQVDLARVLRKLGRTDEARAVLPIPPSADDVSRQVAVELALREYEVGNYDQARQWFERADVDGPHIADTLRAAAATFVFSGDTAAGRRLFARIDHAQDMSRHVGELQHRLQIDPGDRVAAGELKQALDASSSSAADQRGDPLYREHCAACHGAKGDGAGRAARFLFPHPRDFRHSRQRLVSTTGAAATLDDIERVIERGIPGTAMPAFEQLSPQQRRSLAEQVREFRREGLRGKFLADGDASNDSPIDKNELDEAVDKLMATGDVLTVPPIEAANDQSIARGRELYMSVGCHHCHGDDGRGQTELLLFDDAGQRSLPRDLVFERMKGGDKPADLYRRLRLGMPGTPHPATISLDDADLMAMVHFCRSLSQGPKQSTGNYQRAQRAAVNELTKE